MRVKRALIFMLSTVAMTAVVGQAAADTYIYRARPGVIQQTAGTLNLSSSALPSVRINNVFSFDFSERLTKTGPVGEVGYSILPTVPGLDLDPATGILSGSPTAAGSTALTVVASSGEVATSRTYELTIRPAPSITLAESDLPTGTVGQPYSFDFSDVLTTDLDDEAEAQGIIWSAVQTADNGIEIDPENGVLAGTASKAGTYAISVRADAGDIYGDGSYTLVVDGVPLDVSKLFVGKSVGYVITTDGSIYGWGGNTYGQLATGNKTSSSSPVLIFPAGSGIVEVYAGYRSTYFQRSDGTLLAVGDNSTGQLGTGDMSDRLSPVQIPGISGVLTVAAGGQSVLIQTDHGLYGIGRNNYGQLGTGDTATRTTATLITAVPGTFSKLAMSFDHALGLRNGAVWAWGRSAQGQLGRGILTTSSVPVATLITSGATDIAIGFTHSAAVVGAVGMAWGSNADGQLGNGSTSNSATPAAVAGTEGATAVASTSNGICWLINGTVRCTGDGSTGQNGSFSDRSTLGPAIAGLADSVNSLRGGENHLCGQVGSTVECWGANDSGQLGADGSSRTSAAPISDYQG